MQQLDRRLYTITQRSPREVKEWDWKSSLTTATSPSQRGQRGARVAVQGPGMKELTQYLRTNVMNRLSKIALLPDGGI